jgi:hypothetical protein
MADSAESKVVLKQSVLHGSNQPNLVQRVATVYINGKEYRVSAPPEAKGDSLDWVRHFCVRQLVALNSEVEVQNATRVLVLRVVEKELEKEKRDRNKKPHPEHVAQICRNGHIVLGSVKDFQQLRKAFCEHCGAPTIEECQTCGWPIAGTSPNAWMADRGPYQPPRYCGECGKPFPWTESALSTAREYTDELTQLSREEKNVLKGTLDDLTKDTDRTPLAASRFKKFMGKIGPGASGVLQKVLVNVATEAAKKLMGWP